METLHAIWSRSRGISACLMHIRNSNGINLIWWKPSSGVFTELHPSRRNMKYAWEVSQTLTICFWEYLLTTSRFITAMSIMIIIMHIPMRASCRTQLVIVDPEGVVLEIMKLQIFSYALRSKNTKINSIPHTSEKRRKEIERVKLL